MYELSYKLKIMKVKVAVLHEVVHQALHKFTVIIELPLYYCSQHRYAAGQKSV